MTPKEQLELARHLSKAVRIANTSRDVKELIYIGFVDGLAATENYCDQNIKGFCNVLDDIVNKRRRK